MGWLHRKRERQIQFSGKIGNIRYDGNQHGVGILRGNLNKFLHGKQVLPKAKWFSRKLCFVSLAKASQAECVRIIRLLKEERERLGLSKYAVAQISGLSQQAIGYMEEGQRIPSLETVLRVARAMDVDLAKIIKQAHKEPSKPAK